MKDDPKDPLFLHIIGRAGSGKSTFLNTLSQELERQKGNTRFLRTMAPTGTAAFSIGGQTLHASLRLPIGKSKIYKLNGDPLQKLQNEFKDTHIIAIDEKSMVSLTTLYHIDQRLREAKPKNAHKPFGGVSVILMGGM